MAVGVPAGLELRTIALASRFSLIQRLQFGGQDWI